MDINLEGIETIHHLLQQLKTMQKEMKELRNRLSLYEIMINKCLKPCQPCLCQIQAELLTHFLIRAKTFFISLKGQYMKTRRIFIKNTLGSLAAINSCQL